MFYLALLIGLFQMFFAMLVRAFVLVFKKGFLHSLSTFGWIFLLFSVVGMYLRTRQAVDGFYIGSLVITFYKSLPSILISTFSIAGVSLILLFNDLKVNIFVRIGKGIWDLYGITGFFGDLLSYIRLFALGISSAILGTVINSLALSILDIKIPILSHVVFILFLLFAHIGNMLLAMLGAFVHSLRLTFVEFYKNVGFEGGGKAYKPFS